MPRFGIKDYKGLVALPIIVHVGNSEVPGCWIYQKCFKNKCNKSLAYWSKSSEPLYKYRQAKCEDHK